MGSATSAASLTLPADPPTAAPLHMYLVLVDPAAELPAAAGAVPRPVGSGGSGVEMKVWNRCSVTRSSVTLLMAGGGGVI